MLGAELDDPETFLPGFARVSESDEYALSYTRQEALEVLSLCEARELPQSMLDALRWDVVKRSLPKG